jgi:hypothetical protein
MRSDSVPSIGSKSDTVAPPELAPPVATSVRVKSLLVTSMAPPLVPVGVPARSM